MLPKPLINCGCIDGYVMVSQKLLSRSKKPELGTGCAADRLSRADVVAEAQKEWLRLHPSESYDLPLEPWFISRRAKYELRAEYFPARFGPQELKALSENEINIVQTRSVSDALIVRSPH